MLSQCFLSFNYPLIFLDKKCIYVKKRRHFTSFLRQIGKQHELIEEVKRKIKRHQFFTWKKSIKYWWRCRISEFQGSISSTFYNQFLQKIHDLKKTCKYNLIWKMSIQLTPGVHDNSFIHTVTCLRFFEICDVLLLLSNSVKMWTPVLCRIYQCFFTYP